MLVICFSNNIVVRGRGFCTSSIAQITGNVPRLLADIVDRVYQRIMDANHIFFFWCPGIIYCRWIMVVLFLSIFSYSLQLFITAFHFSLSIFPSSNLASSISAFLLLFSLPQPPRCSSLFLLLFPVHAQQISIVYF